MNAPAMQGLYLNAPSYVKNPKLIAWVADMAALCREFDLHAGRYLAGSGGVFAFVSTNSVTQGEPVALMFPALQAAGWRIKFAHRAFAWTSEATGKDSVWTSGRTEVDAAIAREADEAARAERAADRAAEAAADETPGAAAGA